MSSYGGSRHGSRDNLDEYAPRQPQPQPRQPPVPQSRDRSYERQYVRNPPQAESRGAPPSYGQYADVSRAPTNRYGERVAPRSHSPARYEERPQDQYFPSRSHSPSSYAGRGVSPARYDERQPQTQRAERSYSPARTLDAGHRDRYAPSHGYAPSQSGYAPSQSGYAASQSGYAASQSGYAPSQSGYHQGQGYQPAYQTGGRAPAYQQSGSYYPSRPQPSRNYYGYEQTNGRGGYATRHTRPKHKSVTRDGGYYNVYTDAVVKTKKMRLKGVPTTFLAVTRPWSKNHSNQPRDFMPLVIASVFFNPVIGLIALVLSCITKKAVTEENWAKAGLFGRITFWMAVVAILTGIIFFAILIGSVHNDFFAPMHH